MLEIFEKPYKFNSKSTKNCGKKLPEKTKVSEMQEYIKAGAKK